MAKFRFTGKRLLPLVLIIFFFIIILSGTYVFSQETAGGDADLRLIGRVVELIQKEFVEDVNLNKVYDGAFDGIDEYLRSENMTVATLKQIKERIKAERPSPSAEKILAIFKPVFSAYADVEEDEIIFASIRGMMASLKDPYTVYMEPDEFEYLKRSLQGDEFAGIGIYLQADPYTKDLMIIEVMENTPAARAGLKKGDKIVGINNLKTRTMTADEAVERIRGPVNSEVTLDVNRPGVSEPMHFVIKREKIQTKSVSYKMQKGEIGYCQLRVFGEETATELEDALRFFDENGARGYILDLRNNPGGILSTAIDVCSKFLKTGTLVSTLKTRAEKDEIFNSEPNLRPQKPLVILVNEYSASASEVTAGCLRDQKAAVLVGQKTYGKAAVQKVFEIEENGGGIKMTIGYYYTPGGKNINKIGIDPDYPVSMKQSIKLGGKADQQLKIATEILEEKIAGKISAPAEDGMKPIAVDSVAAEYDIIKKNRCPCGGKYRVMEQALVERGGKFFDEIETECDKCGKTRSFVFDINSFFGK